MWLLKNENKDENTVKLIRAKKTKGYQVKNVFKSKVKGKHSAGKELESDCIRKQTVGIDILIESLNSD